MKMRLLSALAFVPIEDGVQSFEVISDDDISEETQGVLDYFEGCWIGRPQ